MIYKKILGFALAIAMSAFLAIVISASESCLHQNAVDDNDCTTELSCPDCNTTIKKENSHAYSTTKIVPVENGIQYGIIQHLSCSNDNCQAKLEKMQDKYVELIGYSAGGTSLTATYGIDFKLLTTYLAENEIYYEYGLVAGSKIYLSDELPLNVTTKAPINDYISKIQIGPYFNNIYDFNISNLLPTHFDTEFAIAVYLIVDTEIYYFQGNEVITTSSGLRFVSYNQLKGEHEGFDNFDFVDTTPSEDRLKQQNASQGDYDIGSTLTQEQLDKISSTAEMLTIGSTILNYPNSAIFMSHFLAGTGDTFTLDLDTFLSNQIAKENMEKDINDALISCEAIAKIGSTLSFNQVNESLFHNLEGDWKYCLGSYFTSVQIDNLTITYAGGRKYYSAEITYIVQDYYNWDERDSSLMFGLISPYELHQLHKAGMAKEFLTYGEKTFKIAWAEGMRADDLIK